jgi:hypothetical protein
MWVKHLTVEHHLLTHYSSHLASGLTSLKQKKSCLLKLTDTVCFSYMLIGHSHSNSRSVLILVVYT